MCMCAAVSLVLVPVAYNWLDFFRKRVCHTWFWRRRVGLVIFSGACTTACFPSFVHLLLLFPCSFNICFPQSLVMVVFDLRLSYLLYYVPDAKLHNFDRRQWLHQFLPSCFCVCFLIQPSSSKIDIHQQKVHRCDFAPPDHVSADSSLYCPFFRASNVHVRFVGATETFGSQEKLTQNLICVTIGTRC
jgi:hypothetical protein